jgi:competence protein ComEA
MRFSLAALAGLLTVVFPAMAQDKFPEGPGKAAVLKVCKGCHPPEIIAIKRHTREEWENVITTMINAGATGTDDEFNLVADYLTEHFPKLTRTNVNKASGSELVAGLGLTQKDADALVAYRQKNGDFKSMEDLKKIPGIDAAKLNPEKIQF